MTRSTSTWAARPATTPPPSNGKLVAYTMTHELDFVVTSDEVLAYYKDQMPMEDLREILPADLQQQLGGALYTATDSEGKPSCLAVDLTGSRFVAGHRGRCRPPGGAHLLSLCAGKRPPYGADRKLSAVRLPAGVKRRQKIHAIFVLGTFATQNRKGPAAAGPFLFSRGMEVIKRDRMT